MMGNSNVNNLVTPDTTIPHNYRGVTVTSHHETLMTRSLQDQANLCSGYNLKTGDLLLYMTQLLLQQGTLVNGISSISNVNSFNNMHLAIHLNCQCVQLSENNQICTNENTDQAALLHGINSISNVNSFNNMHLKLNFIQNCRNNINYFNHGTSSISNVNKFNNIHLTREYNLRTCSFIKNTHCTGLAELTNELLNGIGSISNVNSFNNMDLIIHVKCPCENSNNINNESTGQNELISELISGIGSMSNVNSFKNINLRMRIDCQC